MKREVVVKPRVGISACLAGQPVRFNASRLKHIWIDDVLSRYVEFVPFCPEMMMGLGTPRNTLRLVRGDGGRVQLVEPNSGLDRTTMALEASEKIVKCVSGIDAYIFAAKSPTCGLERVKVYTGKVPVNDGIGIFAEQLSQQCPDLFVIDSGRLHNEEQREVFLKGLFTIARFNRIERSRSSLQEFHRRHKYSLLAHHPEKMRALGRAAAENQEFDSQYLIYRKQLVELLRVQPTRGGIINALEHMYGYLKNSIPDAQKRYFFQTLEKYRRGELTATVPLRILEMLQVGQPHEYLSEQFAWKPAQPLEVQHVM